MKKIFRTSTLSLCYLFSLSLFAQSSLRKSDLVAETTQSEFEQVRATHEKLRMIPHHPLSHSEYYFSQELNRFEPLKDEQYFLASVEGACNELDLSNEKTILKMADLPGGHKADLLKADGSQFRVSPGCKIRGTAGVVSWLPTSTNEKRPEYWRLVDGMKIELGWAMYSRPLRNVTLAVNYYNDSDSPIHIPSMVSLWNEARDIQYDPYEERRAPASENQKTLGPGESYFANYKFFVPKMPNRFVFSVGIETQVLMAYEGREKLSE